MSPIGVGFLELDAEGRFHQQRLRLRSEFRCVTGTSPLNELVESPNIAVVWAGSCTDQTTITLLLKNGKHVLFGLPVDQTWSQFGELLLHGKWYRGQILVAGLHRYDSRLLTVKAVVDKGSLGTISDLRLISRQYVPGELSLNNQTQVTSATATDVSLVETHTLSVQWLQTLDELLQLAPSPVTTVQALPIGVGKAAWINFADGSRAYLELHRRSLVPLETGWIIEGSNSGFAGGRHYRAAADHELIDVPVDQPPTNQEAFYNSLCACVRDGESFPISNESILNVLTLRDNIRSSLESGQIISWTS